MPPIPPSLPLALFSLSMTSPTPPPAIHNQLVLFLPEWAAAGCPCLARLSALFCTTPFAHHRDVALPFALGLFPCCRCRRLRCLKMPSHRPITTRTTQTTCVTSSTSCLTRCVPPPPSARKPCTQRNCASMPISRSLPVNTSLQLVLPLSQSMLTCQSVLPCRICCRFLVYFGYFTLRWLRSPPLKHARTQRACYGQHLMANCFSSTPTFVPLFASDVRSEKDICAVGRIRESTVVPMHSAEAA